MSEQFGMNGEPDTAASTKRIDVYWTPNEITFDDREDRRVTLDFATRRRNTVDLRARTIAVEQLHRLASARSIEAVSQQRIFLILEAGGQRDNDFATPLVEHGLSVMLPQSDTALRKPGLLSRVTRSAGAIDVVERDVVSATYAKRMLWSFTAGIRDAEAAAAYTHVVRQLFGGHPLLLQRIRSAGMVPRSLTLGHFLPMHTGGDFTITCIDGPPVKEVTTEGFVEIVDLDGTDGLVDSRGRSASDPRDLAEPLGCPGTPRRRGRAAQRRARADDMAAVPGAIPSGRSTCPGGRESWSQPQPAR